MAISKAEQTKRSQLGMHSSKASQRLLRSVLFSILIEHGLDICYRCGEKIESVQDLTLDHKEPWLHASVDLFWDVKNIAFSHRGCNSAVRRGSIRRKDGKRWDSQEVRRENTLSSYKRNYPKNKDMYNKRRRERYQEKKVLG
jgi:hypothetical protein